MYCLHIPAPFSHVAPTGRIAEKYFHEDRPTDENDQAIFKKNPYQLLTVTDHNGEVAAYADIYALQPECYDRLIGDKMTETDLLPEHFCPWPEARQIPSLYLAGIAIKDQENPARGLIVNALLNGTLSMIEQHYLENRESIDCAMIAYSPAGIRIAERFGLRYDRKHTYGSVYKKTFTRHVIKECREMLKPLDSEIEISDGNG